MSLPQLHNNNIEEFLDKEDIVKETIEQIKSDFEKFGLEIIFLGKLDNVYQELLQKVKAQVEVLLSGSSDQMYAMLYRIDISDSSILKAAQELPQYSHVEVIAHQIIFRDLQKVLTRRYFRQESQNKAIE
ncbi:MAG: hypothetical protein PF541_06105 [Prolixibacteraceae bacterium]|jgi:hypothetical protein|nr:hypothetical protein [Prolixibacteraceae bacterium]